MEAGFFFQLNEAFAYEYLIGRGYGGVRFVPERIDRRSADLSYLAHGVLRHCEVKSLGITNLEIERRTGCRADDRPYAELQEHVIRKIDAAVRDGRDQIAEFGTAGIVFVNVTPDDFTRTRDDIYRTQLVHYLQSRGCDDVVLRLATADITISSGCHDDEDPR